MKPKSDDNLAEAVSLLQRGARGGSGAGESEDVCELFLAHLKVRRAELRAWIEVLSREAGAAVPAQPGAMFQGMTHYACRERMFSTGGARAAGSRRIARPRRRVPVALPTV